MFYLILFIYSIILEYSVNSDLASYLNDNDVDMLSDSSSNSSGDVSMSSQNNMVNNSDNNANAEDSASDSNDSGPVSVGDNNPDLAQDTGDALGRGRYMSTQEIIADNERVARRGDLPEVIKRFTDADNILSDVERDPDTFPGEENREFLRKVEVDKSLNENNIKRLTKRDDVDNVVDEYFRDISPSREDGPLTEQEAADKTIKKDSENDVTK